MPGPTRRIVSADYVPCTDACRVIEQIIEEGSGRPLLSIRRVCDHPIPLFSIEEPYGIQVHVNLPETAPPCGDPFVAFKLQCQRCRRQWGSWSLRLLGSFQVPAEHDVRAAALAYVIASGFITDERDGCICHRCAGNEGPPVTAEYPLQAPFAEGVSPGATHDWFPWSAVE